MTSTATRTSRKSSGSAASRHRARRLRPRPGDRARAGSATRSSCSGSGPGRSRRRSVLRPGEERVAQRAQEVAEIVLVPEQARPGEHARVRLLDEILGVLARAGERPRGPVEPVEVVSEPGGVERVLHRIGAGRGRCVPGEHRAGPTAAKSVSVGNGAAAGQPSVPPRRRRDDIGRSAESFSGLRRDVVVEGRRCPGHKLTATSISLSERALVGLTRTHATSHVARSLALWDVGRANRFRVRARALRRAARVRPGGDHDLVGRERAAARRRSRAADRRRRRGPLREPRFVRAAPGARRPVPAARRRALSSSDSQRRSQEFSAGATTRTSASFGLRGTTSRATTSTFFSLPSSASGGPC